MSSIKCDDIALELVSGPSRDRYVKVWKQFKAFSKMSNEFEYRMPSEDEFMDFFRHLRIELKQSCSTLWTTYSMVNSVCKGKYGEKLQKFPRITSLLKSYDSDVKKKAAVFEPEDLGRFVSSTTLSTPYWLVRKSIMILCYFGGLRHTEVL